MIENLYLNMPELPEVETMRRDLIQSVKGLTIEKASVYDHRVIKHLAPKSFVQKMKGRTICALSDAAARPAISFVQTFRDEFEFYVREGRSKVRGEEVAYA